MLLRLMDWIGARGALAVWVLAAIAAGNVLLQAGMHKTTPLTAWKGGGFGMYTEPHPDFRTVWLQIDGEGGPVMLRLWPQSDAMTEWRARASVSGDQFLAGLERDAARLRFYPRAGLADGLLQNSARLAWPEEMRGDAVPGENGAFARDRLRIKVFENAYDIQGEGLTRVPVYCRGRGCEG